MSASGPGGPAAPEAASGPDAGERRAWGWLAALRSGSTAPWRGWSGETAPDGPGLPGLHGLPGAQQLELLRRLNLAAAARGARPDPVLVQRVVTASAPGRGSPDLQLVGAAPERRFGPRPVDPADLADDELLRVAASLLAEDLAATGAHRAQAEPAPALTRPWRRPYRLVGVPWLADPLRAELRRRGRPPGGSRAVVVVLGADLATMITLAWTARCFDEGGSTWADWLAAAVGERRIPPRADLEAMARRWAARVGPARVRIVLDPADVPRTIGARLRLAPPPRLPADGIDLARRVSAPLGLLVLPEERVRLLRSALAPRLVAAGRAGGTSEGQPLAVPDEHLPWVRHRAARMRDALLAAGYPVVGGASALDRLVPERGATGRGPQDDRVLALALQLLLEGGVR